MLPEQGMQVTVGSPRFEGQYFILLISIPGAYLWGATDLVGAWGSEGTPSHQASENGGKCDDVKFQSQLCQLPAM